MHWTQNFDPCGYPLLSALLAAVPIVLLLALLAGGRVPAPFAALAGLATAVLMAVFVFSPVEVADHGLPAWAGTVVAAAGHGAAFGLFPIGWIVLAAVFLYALTVETGRFEIVKHSVTSLSDDRRLQALLIAFCFGAFVEGAAGFGTPVAISSALLMGAGFRPLYAAGLALIANTSPVAFGALGTPILTLADVTLPRPDEMPALPVGVSPSDWWTMQLSRMAGRQLPFFSLIVPAWLVAAMAGWRGMVGVWPALLVCGGTFAVVQFLVANLLGPALVDVAGGLASLGSLALFLRFWQPRQAWRFHGEDPPTAPPVGAWSRREVFSAWVPWLLLSALVILWGEPHVKSWLNRIGSTAWQVPGLHGAVWRGPPVGTGTRAEEAIYRLPMLSATGTGIFLAAVLSACWLGVPPARFLAVLGRTLVRLRWPLVTIGCMLALAYVTRYSGMDAALGLALTRTGRAYPFFAALLGWLGVALTGSDTSSNALFGGLQKVTAEGLVRGGVLTSLAPLQAILLLAAANSTGGVMGKMVDAQSIVVSAAATDQPGQEGAILRFVFWHSVALAALMGLLVMAQAFWLQGMIP